MGKRAPKDIGWEHCSKVDGNPNRVCCNYCGHHMFGITRLKEHLAHFKGDVIPCPRCPEELKSQMEEVLRERGIQTREKKKKIGPSLERALDEEDSDLVGDEEKDTLEKAIQESIKTFETEKKKAATEDEELEAACRASAYLYQQDKLMKCGEGCSEAHLGSSGAKDDEIDLNVATDFDSDDDSDLGF